MPTLLSSSLPSDFILNFACEFWLKLQNAKCSGIFLDLPLDSDKIELHSVCWISCAQTGISYCERCPFTLSVGGELMKIIKRNGAEVPFDITKIITAVTKASDSV